MKWYAIYTRSRSEKKVAERLEKAGFEAYCPLQKELKQWSDRKKWVQSPIIPSYVFVRVAPTQIQKVREIPGVVNYVYWLGKPAVVRDEDISGIKLFVENFSDITSQSLNLRKGNRVKINFGPLRGLEGVVMDTSNKKIMLEIDAIGMELKASLSPDLIQRINEN